jgi:hypothetical protein
MRRRWIKLQQEFADATAGASKLSKLPGSPADFAARLN